MPFSLRLQHLIDLKNIFQKNIVEDLNLDKAQVSNWVAGKVTPRRNSLRKLSDYFGCNIEWLATGKGDIFPKETVTRTVHQIDDDSHTNNHSSQSFDIIRNPDQPTQIGLKEKNSKIAELQQIPVLGRVPAGFPNDLTEYVEKYIVLPDPTPPNSYALRVVGQSMEPAIAHDDYVLFVIGRQPSPGDVVVVNDEFGESMIKRFKIKGEEQYLISDNPAYPSFQPNELYRIMGIVIGGWRPLKI